MGARQDEFSLKNLLLAIPRLIRALWRLRKERR
jgi:hypothetical protein